MQVCFELVVSPEPDAADALATGCRRLDPVRYRAARFAPAMRVENRALPHQATEPTWEGSVDRDPLQAISGTCRCA